MCQVVDNLSHQAGAHALRVGADVLYNEGTNSQYSSVADSNCHGAHFSFVQRPTRWGNYRVTYMLSRPP